MKSIKNSLLLFMVVLSAHHTVFGSSTNPLIVRGKRAVIHPPEPQTLLARKQKEEKEKEAKQWTELHSAVHSELYKAGSMRPFNVDPNKQEKAFKKKLEKLTETVLALKKSGGCMQARNPSKRSGHSILADDAQVINHLRKFDELFPKEWHEIMAILDAKI